MINEERSDFHIPLCLIKTWPMDDTNDPMKEPKSPRYITEVDEINIDESYQKLIGTAMIKFPRGTVIKKTITELNGEEVTGKGIVVANIDNGVLITSRTYSKLASTDDFGIGNRIQIMLGYTTDPVIASYANVDSYGKSIHNDPNKFKSYTESLNVMFDGYITQCSVSSPIEIKCENLASRLKKITCPKVTAKTVNELLSEDGKYNLLKNSGLKLYPGTKEMSIDLGTITVYPDFTVADLLTNWAKYKLFAYVKYENNIPYIALGRSYFSGKGKDSILNEDSSRVPEIHFNYHVSDDNLTLLNTDKNFLAVEAKSFGKDDKIYHMTICKNPEYDPEKSGSKKWRILNEVKLSKKAQKAGATVMGSSKDKVDLSIYTIIPYTSRTRGISNEKLLEEAIKHFETYNMNGIDGNLTIFGDLALKTAMKVRLVDTRYPQRNGYYLIDEVETRFGTSGYRQVIKLPYLIAKEKTEEEGKQ